MKLGVNTVLFCSHDLETAFKVISLSGYDGVELSAIGGSEHLFLDHWRDQVPEIKRLASVYDLQLLAIQEPDAEPVKLELAFQAADELGIPNVTTDSGGKANDDASFQKTLDNYANLSQLAEQYGINLCVKPHVGAAIYNTEGMLRLMQAVSSPHFGLNMDPSHIHRAGENAVDTIKMVMPYVKNIHIRDCKGRQQGPGKAELQANGRGDIDLVNFFRVLHENAYPGPVDLEVIGAKDYSLVQCAVIAAEARGHMQACLQACGAR